MDPHIILRDGERLARGNPDHLLDKVDAGDQFSHRVFHLQAGVHLKEIEIAIPIHDEFHRAGGRVANCLGQRCRLIAHGLAGGLIEERAGRFFDYLLVAALDRAFPLVEVDGIAVTITEHLNFDVTGLRHELLNENAIVAEGVCRLILGRLKALARFLIIPRDPHPLAAATGRGLDHHRIADLVRDLDRFIGVLDQAHVAGHGRHIRLLGNLLGGDLVAHGLNRPLGRADKGHAGGFQSLGEFRVLRQEAIARMHGLGASVLDRLQDLVDHDVRLIGRGRADMHRLICHFDMQRIAVGIRIDRDRLDTHFAGGFDDPAGNLAPVGDQDLLEHGGRPLSWFAAGANGSWRANCENGDRGWRYIAGPGSVSMDLI